MTTASPEPFSQADVERLLASAKNVRERAYAPYSEFRVGCAVLADDGEVYLGTNVENVSYGATLCAERSAVSAMIAAGARRPVLVLIFTADRLATPCGLCRQVLHEFAPDATVVSRTDDQEARFTVTQLLPHPFVR